MYMIQQHSWVVIWVNGYEMPPATVKLTSMPKENHSLTCSVCQRMCVKSALKTIVLYCKAKGCNVIFAIFTDTCSMLGCCLPFCLNAPGSTVLQCLPTVQTMSVPICAVSKGTEKTVFCTTALGANTLS